MTDTHPTLDLKQVEFRVLPMRTRFPFKYGIASLTALPHLVLQVKVEVNGILADGIASEGLPPKWFTKSPDTTFEQDLPAMLAVIGKAVETALDAPRGSFFDLWRNLYQGQTAWATDTGHPPLLANLGVSFVERAVLDALCRHLERPAHEVIRANLLGLRLGGVRPELAELSPAEVLPEKPLSAIVARHTIGLGDPLTPADVTDETQADDNLPLDLESCVKTYGLTHFKIKVCGDLATDLPRLRKIAELLDPQALFTLDGNEQYPSIAAFREHWEAWQEDDFVRAFLDAGLLLVEQPAHRDETFAAGVADDLDDWPDRPPFIIDEADGSIDSLPTALDLGYDGSSHKNCKGIVKGLANAATLANAANNRQRPVHLTGEDLANVGPIALLQDLAIIATLGITHVERNGHHYFRGLSAWPEPVKETILAHHGDLYHRHPDGYPTLLIEDGMLNLSSVNAAPFGLHPQLDCQELAEVDLSDVLAFLAAGLPT
ncbi:MAG: enolase C-terminal domain-like protein [Opitutales bacterium]